MTDPNETPPRNSGTNRVRSDTGTFYEVSGSGTYRAVKDGDLREPMHLGDFLMGLGIVLRLPGKKQATTAAEIVAAIPQRQQRSHVVAISLSLVVILGAAVIIPPMFPSRGDPLPPRLMGSWKTQSPKFAERGFEIRGEELRMQRGPSETDVAVLGIHRVRVTPHGDDTAVEIEYVEDGVRQSLDLTMHDFAGATVLELRNQPTVIWRRARSASATPAFPAGIELPPGAINAGPTRR